MTTKKLPQQNMLRFIRSVKRKIKITEEEVAALNVSICQLHGKLDAWLESLRIIEAEIRRDNTLSPLDTARGEG